MARSRVATGLGVAVALLAGALAVNAQQAAPPGSTLSVAGERREWRSMLLKDHPLVGTAWSVRERRAVPLDPAAWGLARADIVVLGEQHDNKDHHVLQGDVIAALARLRAAAGQPKPAVVMEQLKSDQQAVLDQLGSGSAVTLDTLKSDLDWARSGWAGYDYDPVFRAVLAAQLPLVAGDPSRDEIRAVARGGVALIAAPERTRLGLDTPLPEPVRAALYKQISESHCGLLPEAAFPPMAVAQRYRDARLADATLAAARAHGQAILVTGNEHARADRGAPWYVHARAPALSVVSVMFLEVEEGERDAAAYVPNDPEERPVADYLVFTPRAARGDPCEEMRAQMQRMKKK